jgi:hypothetical protein
MSPLTRAGILNARRKVELFYRVDPAAAEAYAKRHIQLGWEQRRNDTHPQRGHAMWAVAQAIDAAYRDIRKRDPRGGDPGE